MPIVRANGIDICFESDGPDDATTVLLVNGFRSQLTHWEPLLVALLNEAGFRVVRFDNRDVGLTSKTPGDPVPGEPAYTLDDMANDGMELLSVLGIERAHVMGASMGGMIVQHMAFGHPERVLSLTSVMSTTGNPNVGQATPEAMQALMTPSPPERDAYIDNAARTWKIISGSHYDEAHIREKAAASFDRMFYPKGALFQMAAIMSSGDRTERLGTVTCPTLVIHGRMDPLITLSGGEATAAAIPGAELVVFDDMGHDLPPPIIPRAVEAFTRNAARVGATT
jgi:pimeloyl-ACP methyl ester carboxylesterase